MFELRNPRGRFFVALGLHICLLLVFAPRLQAQQLSLKRDLPGTDSIACPEVDPGQEPSDEEREEAIRLGSFADQETILGDYERARDLLARAAELDPTSAELAYRYGRVLESLEETELAIEQFCRALGLGSREQGIGDARPRLEALARAREPLLPEGARSEFLNGLLQADLGDFEGAVESFGNAIDLAPDWGHPVYNRGVIRIRLGDAEGAVEDLQAYLALRPDAEDAILVSQRIGQLQIVPTRGVSAGTAFGLGLVLPGGGQFYSGRALGGLGVLALAGGAAAAGLLIEEVEIRCVGSASSSNCPPERIISESTTKPYKTYGLAAAGAVAFLGALEAFLKARGPSGGENEEPTGVEIGSARILFPRVSTFGPQVQINLVRVTF
ncbi:MAG: tetratricopeptide repeat protein [Gemmatimonadota bacterium]|jgi:tetratricopeptide (TPR) repeat protein